MTEARENKTTKFMKLKTDIRRFYQSQNAYFTLSTLT